MMAERSDANEACSFPEMRAMTISVYRRAMIAVNEEAIYAWGGVCQHAFNFRCTRRYGDPPPRPHNAI